jgi:hypothetical protein
MQPESKLQFDKACQVMGLDPAARDLAWKRLSDLGIPPSDPTSVLLAVGGLLEKAADTLPNIVNSIPARVEEAAKRAVGPVSEAATAKVEAAHARLAGNLSEVVKGEVASHLKQVEIRREMGLGACIAVACVLTAVAGGYVGWSIGRSDVSGLATEWASLASRSDSRNWLQLISANPNITATLMGNCYAGSPSVWSQLGASACKVPMWLDSARAPTAAGTIRSTYQSVTDWLASWNLVVLVVGSVLSGLFGAKAIRSFKSLRPIRWIID